MKSIICFFVVVACLLAFSASSANAALVGSWRHDEAAGNLIDSTGAHPAGIATGTPTYGQPGVPNGTYGAINVTGASGTAIGYGPSDVDEFFTIGADNNNPVMNLNATDAFTVMGWVNPAAPTVARTYRFLSTGSAAGADRGWGVGLRVPNTAGTGSSIRFTTYGIADNDSSVFDVAFGQWVHVAATYNNGQINYFLNGNALDSDTSVFGNEAAAGRLVVGGRLGANDADQMNGLVDGVQVFNEVLTAAQIRQAAAASVVPEPSTTMLLGVVGCLALARRRRS
jgi:hypothetical protein